MFVVGQMLEGMVLTPRLVGERIGLHPVAVIFGIMAGGQLYGFFGILLAFGLTYPEARLMLLFPPIPIKAKWFVLIYGAIELAAGVTGTLEGVAHFAHLGGMLTGLFLFYRWRLGPWG